MEQEKQKQEVKAFVLSLDERNPSLEGKFNIHLGDIYRVVVAGMNPMDRITYDGVLTIFRGRLVDDNSFITDAVTLENGLIIPNYSKEILFDKEVLCPKGFNLFSASRMVYSENFYKMRDQILKFNKMKGDNN